MNIEMIRIKHLLSNINRIRISITAKNQLHPPLPPAPQPPSQICIISIFLFYISHTDQNKNRK